jgi:signal transduction histidine kinase
VGSGGHRLLRTRTTRPPTEARLADFAELVATAIANAQARDELMASRARIVAAGDEARRRIERDLHDGAQQRLVTLTMHVRSLEASLPSDNGLKHESSASLKNSRQQVRNCASSRAAFIRPFCPMRAYAQRCAPCVAVPPCRSN